MFVWLLPGGGYSRYGLTGSPVGLRVALNGYQIALFPKPLKPTGGIPRANYKISTRYSRPHANLAVAAKVTMNFEVVLLSSISFGNRNYEKIQKIFTTRC